MGTAEYHDGFIDHVKTEAGLLTIVEAQKRTEAFLAGQMLAAVRTVE